MLLILSGDIETNPGPGREKKPDPKKVMEEKVNTHDEKIWILNLNMQNLGYWIHNFSLK